MWALSQVSSISFDFGVADWALLFFGDWFDVHHPHGTGFSSVQPAGPTNQQGIQRLKAPHQFSQKIHTEAALKWPAGIDLCQACPCLTHCCCQDTPACSRPVNIYFCHHHPFSEPDEALWNKNLLRMQNSVWHLLQSVILTPPSFLHVYYSGEEHTCFCPWFYHPGVCPELSQLSF